MSEDRTQIEREIDRLADRVQWPESQAKEVMVGETTPFKPEDPDIVAIRLELRAIAEQLRLKARDFRYLSPAQKRALEAAASTVERAI